MFKSRMMVAVAIIVALIGAAGITLFLLTGGITTLFPPEETEPAIKTLPPSLDSYRDLLTRDEFESIVQPTEGLIVTQSQLPTMNEATFGYTTAFATAEGKVAMALNVFEFDSTLAADRYFDSLLQNLEPLGAKLMSSNVIGERSMILPSNSTGVWSVIGFVRDRQVVFTPHCGESPFAILHLYVPTDEQLIELLQIIEAKLPG